MTALILRLIRRGLVAATIAIENTIDRIERRAEVRSTLLAFAVGDLTFEEAISGLRFCGLSRVDAHRSVIGARKVSVARDALSFALMVAGAIAAVVTIAAALGRL